MKNTEKIQNTEAKETTVEVGNTETKVTIPEVITLKITSVKKMYETIKETTDPLIIKVLIERFPELFIKTILIMPDNCKIFVEPILKEIVPQITLPISDKARKKVKQQQELELLKSLPLEERLLQSFNTFKK